MCLFKDLENLELLKSNYKDVNVHFATPTNADSQGYNLFSMLFARLFRGCRSCHHSPP